MARKAKKKSKSLSKLSSRTKKSKLGKKLKGSKLGKIASKVKGRGTTTKKPKSAKSMLKKAYETRAKRQIRLGQLGIARKTLRKKATVI